MVISEISIPLSDASLKCMVNYVPNFSDAFLSSDEVKALTVEMLQDEKSNIFTCIFMSGSAVEMKGRWIDTISVVILSCVSLILGLKVSFRGNIN